MFHAVCRFFFFLIITRQRRSNLFRVLFMIVVKPHSFKLTCKCEIIFTIIFISSANFQLFTTRVFINSMKRFENANIKGLYNLSNGAFFFQCEFSAGSVAIIIRFLAWLCTITSSNSLYTFCVFILIHLEMVFE